jgi:two-component system KDP operon response regulator KdpE
VRAPVILVIDDEPQIRRALSDALASLPARVLEARTARQGVEVSAVEHPDLIVLDLGLPDGTGLDVCAEIRRWSGAPIVVLSARHAEADKIALLNAGADDYVSKPFQIGELIARISAQLRRSRAPLGGGVSIVECDGLTVDIPRRVVRRDDTVVKLTPIEWAILQTLARHAGRPVTHQQIFDAVWGRTYGNPQQYLRVYVTHLRRKIERNPAEPRIIFTEPGVGYRFGNEET